MPTFIILANFTQKGIENIRDTAKRLKKASEIIESVGGKIKKAYYTLGEYDVILISEFPNEEACMKAILSNNSLGNVRTKTLVAVSSEKAAEIIKELPE